MTYLVGLTGGIGSGKSTVAKLFAELGVTVIDTDIISHQLTQTGGSAIPDIQAAFGKDSLDATGALNRAKMRQLVFSNPSAKLQLEKILHPLILRQTQTLANSSTTPYKLVVVPLLFESNQYQNWLNRTVTVDCPEATQITRATLRSGLSEQAVRAILAQQFSREQRLARSDDVILNEGTLEKLQPQITRLHQCYLQLAQRNNN